MDNTDKIKKLELKINKLKKEQEEYNKKPVDIKLAELIHTYSCTSNHIDQCGWDYESWDKIGNTRQRYLNKSKEILKKFDFDTAYNLIKILFKY